MFKGKNKVWFCDNPYFKISYFQAKFFACNSCFGLFNKIKNGLGKSVWCAFSKWFFCKDVPYLILRQLTKFHCHSVFPFQDIKQNVLLSFYLDNWWRHKLIRSSVKEMADSEKMKGDRNIKTEYLKNKKNFLDELTSIFHNYWGAIIWWKKKWIITGTSFKYFNNFWRWQKFSAK